MPSKVYQLVDRETDGLVTADQVMEFIAGLQDLRYLYVYVFCTGVYLKLRFRLKASHITTQRLIVRTCRLHC